MIFVPNRSFILKENIRARYPELLSWVKIQKILRVTGFK